MPSCVWVESRQGIPPIPCEWVKRNYGKERQDWDSPHPCDGVIWRYNNNLWGINKDYEWLYGETFDAIDVKDVESTHSFAISYKLCEGDGIVLSLTNAITTIGGETKHIADMSKTIMLANEKDNITEIICTPEPDDFVVVDFGDIVANVRGVYNIVSGTQEVSVQLKALDGVVVNCDLDVYILKKI